MDGDPRLLLALRRHALADLIKKPRLKLLRRLHRSTTHHECVGIEHVDHLVEEEPKGACLHAEDLAAEVVAPFREPADLLCRLGDVARSGEFVIGVLLEEIGQQGAADRRQRAERLQVAGPPAVACRHDAFDARDLAERDQHMSQFATEAVSAGDDLAGGDHSAAQARADDRGNARCRVLRPEDGDVAPEGGGVAVVEVGHRPTEPPIEAGPDVVARPLSVHEVRRAALAQHARAAGGPRRVEADRYDVLYLHACLLGGHRQPVGNLAKADVWPFDASCRVFAQTIDQELPPLVEERVIDRRAAQIDAGHDLHQFCCGCHELLPFPTVKCLPPSIRPVSNRPVPASRGRGSPAGHATAGFPAHRRAPFAQAYLRGAWLPQRPDGR